MMVTDDAYDLIVEQTYLNAQQALMTQPIRSSRLKKWKDTDKGEIKKFLAIVLYMGMVKLLFILKQRFLLQKQFYSSNNESK